MVVLEEFLLINGVMDGLLLWGALRAVGVRRVRMGRLALSAACGAGFAALAYLPGWGVLMGWGPRLGCAGVMCALAAGKLPWRAWCKGTGYLCVGAWVTGGIAMALYRPGQHVSLLLLLTVPVAVGVGLAILRRQRAPQVARVGLEIVYEGMRVYLEGMVDTGNAAQDPISGLPLIIVPVEKLFAWFPHDIEPLNALALQPGMRLVSIQTATGRRMLPCFRPDTLHVVTEAGEGEAQAVIAAAPRGMLPMALVPPYALGDVQGGALGRRLA